MVPFFVITSTHSLESGIGPQPIEAEQEALAKGFLVEGFTRGNFPNAPSSQNATTHGSNGSATARAARVGTDSGTLRTGVAVETGAVSRHRTVSRGAGYGAGFNQNSEIKDLN